jgi:hypothetical protein
MNEIEIGALLEQRLIEPNTWNNLGGSVGGVKELLTDLGTALFQRVEKYNKFKEGQCRSAGQTDYIYQFGNARTTAGIGCGD